MFYAWKSYKYEQSLSLEAIFTDDSVTDILVLIGCWVHYQPWAGKGPDHGINVYQLTRSNPSVRDTSVGWEDTDVGPTGTYYAMHVTFNRE
jgi:hypothetical protein